MATEKNVKQKLKSFRPKSQNVRLFDFNINDTSSKLYKFKNQSGLSFKVWIYGDRIVLETPLTAALLFAINFPDKVCLANHQIDEIEGIGKVFTDRSNDDKIQACLKLLAEELKSLELDLKNEGMRVYRNSLQLILDSQRQILPEIEICTTIKSKIENNFPVHDYDFDYSDLPTVFKHLVVKFESWAISDDFERQEKIKESTSIELKNLIGAFESNLGDINKYLDSFNEIPLTEGAIKLQSLAELTIELKLNPKNKNHS